MALEKGFVKKNFNQVKAEIEDSLTDSLGDINLVAPSVFSNVVAVFAERESQLWDMLESVYNAGVPSIAEGYSLDAVCALNGIKRLDATYSTVTGQITAINYTKIPKNTKVAVKTSGKVFLLENDITVSNDKCYKAKLEISSNVETTYVVTINGTGITYTRDSDKTKSEIATALITLINEQSSTLKVSSTANDAEVTITTTDSDKVFSCLTFGSVKLLEVTSNGKFISEETGSIAVPVGSLTEIQTPVSGLISVSNAKAGDIGRELESDIELRARRSNSLSFSGSGTLEAIRASVLNIEGVTSASISENNTDNTDTSTNMPPHSFQLLVAGGNDQSIANTIWQKKPAGIQSFGNVTVVVKDSNNKEHNISFSRANKKYIFAKVTITKTTEFIESSTQVIKNNIVAQVNSLGSGNKVILNSLYSSVFSEKGIVSADIEIGGSSTESPKPTLSKNDVDILASEVAITDASKIEIVLQDA